MNPEDRQPLHVGLNFYLSNFPKLKSGDAARFMLAIQEQGVEVSAAKQAENRIDILREEPTILNVTLIKHPQAPAGQLLIVAPTPNRPMDFIRQESEAVVHAFKNYWPGDRQILAGDTTYRELRHTHTHAFKELWEGRLKQDAKSLKLLGRPVLGGGLRFVLPPFQDAKDLIELKIESFLSDSTKVFIEVTFKWETISNEFDIQHRLDSMRDYVENCVTPFLRGEGTDDPQ